MNVVSYFFLFPLVKGARGMSLRMGFGVMLHADGTSPCPLHKGEAAYSTFNLFLFL